MEWNVKNAINRDVERQHLNKILKDIRETVDSIAAKVRNGSSASLSELLGSMVEDNIEEGISVTYDSENQTLNFVVNDFTIRLTGDLTGTGQVVGLRDVNIETTLDPSLVGVPEAPIDGYPYWRYGGEWELVTGGLYLIEDIQDNGLMVKVYDMDEHTWLARQIEGEAGQIEVENPDGVDGNPTIGLSQVEDSEEGELVGIERDEFGRVTGMKPVVAGANITITDLGTSIEISSSGGGAGGILPVVTGEIVDSQPVFVYLDDGSLVYVEVA